MSGPVLDQMLTAADTTSCWAMRPLAYIWFAVAVSVPCGIALSYMVLKSFRPSITGAELTVGVRPSAQTPS
jgi:hypothetical protein